MKVLVDTCVWSLALRRSTKTQSSVVTELEELIDEVRVQLIGPIRQELLSGIKSPQQFDLLKEKLNAFPDLTLGQADYERAAGYYNLARNSGVRGSNTDFLICSVAVGHGMAVFTVDKDFENYKKILPVKLHQLRVS